MNENDLEAIGERLTRLERDVRLWKRAATAAIVLLVALIAFNPTPRTRAARAADSSARDLAARSLKIVDEQGTPRALLMADKDGSRLVLFDKKGTLRAGLASGKDGAALGLFDEKGTLRSDLEVNEDGYGPSPKLDLRDEKGTQRAVLYGGGLDLSDEKRTTGTSLGTGALWLRDEKGTTLVNLEADGDGPMLMLSDVKGKGRVFLAADKDGPSLDLDDEKGKPRAVFGSAQLENARTGATEATGLSSVTLFDKAGKTIWRAP